MVSKQEDSLPAPDHTPPTGSQMPTVPDTSEDKEELVVDEVQDLQDDAILAALESGKTRPEALAELREAKAAAAAKKDDTTPSGDDQADDSDDSDDEGDGEAAESKEQLDRAKNALRRGLPKSLHDSIDKMTDEQVLEAGSAMAEHQAEQDRVGNELAQLKAGKKAAEDGNEGKPEGKKEEEGAPAQPTSALDFSTVFEPLDPDLYGKELPETLTKFGNTLADHFNDRVEKAVLSLNSGFEEYVTDSVRRQEADRNPLLRDADSWARVKTAMDELEPGMKFTDELIHERKTRLLNRALHAEFPKEMAKLEAKKVSRRNSAKRTNGQPDPKEERSVEGPATLTEEQAQDAWLDARERTGSKRKAAEAAGY